MATNDSSTLEVTGHQRTLGDHEEDSGREELAFPQEYGAMNVSPGTHRPPMPLPVGGRHLETSGRTRVSTGGTYQYVPNSDPDTQRNGAYRTADRHRARIQRGDTSASQRESTDHDETRPLLHNHPNEAFGISMKNYILSSVGLLHPSCTWIAMVFYLFLMAWGVGILTMATQIVFTSLKEEGCAKLIPSFALAMLGGAFFILVGLYWALVFWRTRISVGTSRRVSFSFLTILWFVLALLLVGTAAALAAEVYEYRNILANFTANIPCDSTDIVEDSTLSYHFNLIPMLALGSMVILWMVYVCVFLVQCFTSSTFFS